MIRVLFFLGFLVLFVFKINADDFDNLRTVDNRYLIDNSYKRFVEGFNSSNDPCEIEASGFSWGSKFLFNNGVIINLPCAYILHLQDQFLKSVDRKQAESISHLLKLTQIDGFYFTYKKQSVTKTQAKFLALMFERSNVLTNILDQRNDNIYIQAIKQHFDMIINDHKKLQEWGDVKDTNKFNDNLWVTLGNLGDSKTKKRIDLIKELGISRRNLMPDFILNEYFEKIRTNNFLGFDYKQLVNFFRSSHKEKSSPICFLGEYMLCEFCNNFVWEERKRCDRCKKHWRFEGECKHRVLQTANVQLREETDETRVIPARQVIEEYYEKHIFRKNPWKEEVRLYKNYRPLWIAERKERLVKVTNKYYEFSNEQKTEIRQNLSKQSIMFKKKRLAYLLYYLKNHPALKFRREIFAEIGEYLLEYKKPADTFFKSIKPTLLVSETKEDCWEIQH